MQYWYNLNTKQVEADDNDRSAASHLLGPYASQAEAERAIEIAHEKTEAWDEAERAERER